MKGSTTKRARFKITDFKGLNTTISKKLLPLQYSPNAYNFTFSGGALEGKIGIDEAWLGVLTDSNLTHKLPNLPVGETIQNLHFYRRYDFSRQIRDDKIVVHCESGNYYITSLWQTDVFTKLENISVTSSDCSVCYRYNGNDVLIVAGSGGGMYIIDNTTVTYVQDAPSITSMCVHYERIYATVAGESNSLWFSDDFNPTNWRASATEGGFINFDDDGGRVVRAVSFLDHVYVFRDYAIVRLTAYGSQESYSLSKVFVSTARILKDTIVCCGDRILFLTDEGLFSFNGYTITPIAKEIGGVIKNDRAKARAAYVKGNYFLACRLKTDNNKILGELQAGFENNVVVRIRLKTGEIDILRGVDVREMISVESLHVAETLVCFRGLDCDKIGLLSESGKIFSTVTPKHWESAANDLGSPNTEKTVRNVWITTETPCTLTVTVGNDKKAFSLKGNAEPQKAVVNRRGRIVGLALDSTSMAPHIGEIVLEADLA